MAAASSSSGSEFFFLRMLHWFGFFCLFLSCCFVSFPLYSSLVEGLKIKLLSFSGVESSLAERVTSKLIKNDVFADNILGQKEERLIKLLGESDGSALYTFLHGLCCLIFWVSRGWRKDVIVFESLFCYSAIWFGRVKELEAVGRSWYCLSFPCSCASCSCSGSNSLCFLCLVFARLLVLSVHFPFFLFLLAALLVCM